MGIIAYIQVHIKRNEIRTILVQDFYSELSRNVPILRQFSTASGATYVAVTGTNIAISNYYLHKLASSDYAAVSNRLRNLLIQQDNAINSYNERANNFLITGGHALSFSKMQNLVNAQQQAKVILGNYTLIACDFSKKYSSFNKFCHYDVYKINGYYKRNMAHPEVYYRKQK